MATLTFLKGGGRAGLVTAGVYGQRLEDGSLQVDRNLHRIYLFSLNPVIRAEEQQMVDLEVPDDLLPALKANLLQLASQRWAQAYESQAPLAGPLESAVRAEQAMVERHCQDIIRELGFDQPRPVVVDLECSIALTREQDDEGEDFVEATVHAYQFARAARHADLAVDTRPMGAFPAEMTLQPGEYEGTVRMEMDLHGTHEQLRALVPLTMAQIVGAGMVAPKAATSDEPKAVIVACERCTDEQDEAPAAPQP